MTVIHSLRVLWVEKWHCLYVMQNNIRQRCLHTGKEIDMTSQPVVIIITIIIIIIIQAFVRRTMSANILNLRRTNK